MRLILYLMTCVVLSMSLTACSAKRVHVEPPKAVLPAPPTCIEAPPVVFEACGTRVCLDLSEARALLVHKLVTDECIAAYEAWARKACEVVQCVG